MAVKITQAIILSAGFGTRLEPITRGKIPKVMVPFCGKPILQWHIERLRSYGIEEILINLSHLPEVVQNYFGDGSEWKVRIVYYVETPDIMGTAGGIKDFEQKLRDDFLVCYGDVFNLIDYAKMVKSYRKRPGIIAMTTIGDNDHPEDSDLVEVDDDMKFIKIHPKPHTTLPPNYKTMLAAAFIFNKKILKYIPSHTYYEIDHQLLPDILTKKEPVYGYECPDYIQDIGTPERYEKVQEYLQNNPDLR